jgi:hypothetical protein
LFQKSETNPFSLRRLQKNLGNAFANDGVAVKPVEGVQTPRSKERVQFILEKSFQSFSHTISEALINISDLETA